MLQQMESKIKNRASKESLITRNYDPVTTSYPKAKSET